MKATALLLALLLAVLLAVPAVHAQAPPGTDILLIEMPLLPHEARAPLPEQLTNRPGYDNQPTFTPDGRYLLYTAIRDDGQADIYRIDLAQRTHTRLTHTPESEYSPTILPDADGFSVVRVEADTTQRLWAFDWAGEQPTLLLPEVAPVGYHAWADTQTVALFVLGEPPTLQLVDIRTGRADTVARDIGRSLHKVPGRAAVSFVQKTESGPWKIMLVDLETRAITPLAETLPGREDYAWTPDGRLLMADGAVLYLFDFDAGTWQPLADLESSGVAEITRLAVSPAGNLLALVVNRMAE